jgi:triacylglycerol esterase/lipase EstA (alpha/beta hydrolase family)
MIDVKIIEGDGYTALCTVTGKDEEFRADIARIKRVPYENREFVADAEPKYWRIRKAKLYADTVVEIGDAIRVHERQGRLPI